MKTFTQWLHETYTPEQMAVANVTSRARGAIGGKAITPRYVETVAHPKHEILDYGAGRDAAHAETLKGKGLNVTAHEFGQNQNQRHDPKALTRKYDIVYASNVLNTQSSKAMMASTIDQIRAAVKPGGSFIGNFPMSPRKAGDIDASHVQAELERRFKTVKRVGGTKQAPLFHASDSQ